MHTQYKFHYPNKALADQPADKWTCRFMDMAKLVSTWSKDPSTKVGAVITDDKRFISLGYNGFPTGTNDNPALYQNREEKYRRVIHAEANAIIYAGGRDLRGCHIFIWPFLSCSSCAGLIIHSGITKVTTMISNVERWQESFNSAMAMYDEVGVKVKFLVEP